MADLQQEKPGDQQVSENCGQLFSGFETLLEITMDQVEVCKEIRGALWEKKWQVLKKNLDRLERLAREQTRLSARILELREGLQRHFGAGDGLLRVSELLPLLPEQYREPIRTLWMRLRAELVRRKSEFSVLRRYSEGRQEMVQGFLSLLREDEGDCGQVYGRGGRFQSALTNSKIFQGEA